MRYRTKGKNDYLKEFLSFSILLQNQTWGQVQKTSNVTGFLSPTPGVHFLLEQSPLCPSSEPPVTFYTWTSAKKTPVLHAPPSCSNHPLNLEKPPFTSPSYIVLNSKPISTPSREPPTTTSHWHSTYQELTNTYECLFAIFYSALMFLLLTTTFDESLRTLCNGPEHVTVCRM